MSREIQVRLDITITDDADPLAVADALFALACDINDDGIESVNFSEWRDRDNTDGDPYPTTGERWQG